MSLCIWIAIVSAFSVLQMNKSTNATYFTAFLLHITMMVEPTPIMSFWIGEWCTRPAAKKSVFHLIAAGPRGSKIDLFTLPKSLGKTLDSPSVLKGVPVVSNIFLLAFFCVCLVPPSLLNAVQLSGSGSSWTLEGYIKEWYRIWFWKKKMTKQSYQILLGLKTDLKALEL